MQDFKAKCGTLLDAQDIVLGQDGPAVAVVSCNLREADQAVHLSRQRDSPRQAWLESHQPLQELRAQYPLHKGCA